MKRIEIEEILDFQKQDEYDDWHFTQAELVYNCLLSRAGNRERINNDEGLRYGHATKILNLFAGHIVFYSPYFTREEVSLVKHFLHVPLDSKVFDALIDCNVKDVPVRIKHITRNIYENLQKEIRSVASNHKLPPLYFDEYAWAFDKSDT